MSLLHSWFLISSILQAYNVLFCGGKGIHYRDSHKKDCINTSTCGNVAVFDIYKKIIFLGESKLNVNNNFILTIYAPRFHHCIYLQTIISKLRYIKRSHHCYVKYQDFDIIIFKIFFHHCNKLSYTETLPQL